MNNNHTKCLIIGSGPAGYTAAIYASRANLSPILYEGNQPGGQLTITTEVENFPGYPEGISGTQLMDDLRAQAERFGVEIRTGIITKVDFSERPYKLTIDDEKEIEKLRDTEVDGIEPVTLCESDFRSADDLPTVSEMIALEPLVVFEE